MVSIEEIDDSSSSGKATPAVDDILVEELPDELPTSAPEPPPNPPSSNTTSLDPSSPDFTNLPLADQANTLFPLLLHPHPPPIPNAAEVAKQLLQTNIRSLFLSNPNISTSGRAQKPSLALLDDANHDQAWKIDGIDLALKWCISHSPTLNLILPPTLTMMDDWEPSWRVKGVGVLSTWVFSIPPDELKSKGLDSLLLSSLEHTLSLHEDTPGVLKIAIRLANNLSPERRAKHLSSLVDKALILGWKYAKREQQAQIARDTELLCNVMGEGIARWTKAIVPSLLSPLQYPPVPSTLDLIHANLSALLVFLRTVNGVHAERWRGQILAITARSWIMLKERWPDVSLRDSMDIDASIDASEDTPETGEVQAILTAISEVYGLLADLPGVKEDFEVLLKTNESVFAPLVASAA